MSSPQIKKHIACGSVALLLTGMTFAMFTSAEPRGRDEFAPVAGEVAPTFVQSAQASKLSA